MKKAIFLVDDIKNGKVITFLESLYSKLIDKLESEGTYLMWLQEIGKLLYNHPSDFIKFMSVKDFMNLNTMPNDRDVFYFISCRHNLDLLSVDHFLGMDPEVSDFLVRNNIPIILDTSMEIVNHDAGSYRLLDGNSHFLSNIKWFRGIHNLKFYIVGSTHRVSLDRRHRDIQTLLSVFPGPFFQYNFKGSELNNRLTVEKNQILANALNKKIDTSTLVWQAYSSNPRVNRSLFQMKVEHENLVDGVGKYSRLMPGTEQYIADSIKLELYLDADRMTFANKDQIKKLNNIKIIDNDVGGVTSLADSNFLFSVVLETFCPEERNDFTNSISFLTEKTAMAIFSGVPFIPLGGHHIGTILKSYGFREYKGLEFPTQPHFLDELDYVIEKIRTIHAMSIEEKQDLYNSWKPTIEYNFNRYMNIDIKKVYLETLNKSIIAGPQW
jgi:hypothetical protein